MQAGIGEEEWEEEAAGSVAELARQLGVSSKWCHKTLQNTFGERVTDEQSYRGEGQYCPTPDGDYRFVPGQKATWVTKGQSQVLAEFAKDVHWKMSRRNGPVVRIQST